MTLTNDVVEMSGVVIKTSADVTLDTNGRDRSFKIRSTECTLSAERFRIIGGYILYKLNIMANSFLIKCHILLD